MIGNPQHLWEQLRKGNQAALSALFRLYYGELLHYGQHFYTHDPIVEDKIQEIFLHLWEQQAQLSQPKNILAFLVRALRNALIDESRRRQSQHKLMSEVTWLTTQTTEETPDLIEKRAQLQTALLQLSETQREIIFLRFYNQLPYSEIAEIVDMQYQSVRNAAHRGMKVLRKTING